VLVSQGSRLRLFVALELPDQWRAALAGEARSLESAAPGFGRWVDPSLMHVTLVFLGSQDVSLVLTIEGAVSRAAGASQPFSLGLASPGSFGGRRSLRVMWVGVQDQPAGSLGRLYAAVSTQLQAANISFDASPFRAHITLGRARRDATSAQSEAMYNAIARRAAASGQNPPVEPLQCERLTLMQSTLRSSGPIYTPLYRARLAGIEQ
jgi:RNA 2',3'-cyclic 3'-phosphodiesterase